MSLQNQVVRCSNYHVMLYKEVKQFGQEKEKQHIGYFKGIMTDPDPCQSQTGDRPGTQELSLRCLTKHKKREKRCISFLVGK